MKPYLRNYEFPGKLGDYPNGTYFEAGFLVSKNSGWRSKRPVIDRTKCINCLQCYLYCPDGAVKRKENTVAFDYDFCKGCGICKKICPKNAIEMEAEK